MIVRSCYFSQMWQLETLLREMVSSEEGQKFRRSHSLTKAMIPRRYRTPVSRFISKATEFIQENWKRIWVLSLWVTINLILFIWKFKQYEKRNAFKIMGYCVCVAKGAAETLKFNMALILFPVCRKTLTKLRSTRFSTIVPFDDNINFHKVIALGIAVGTGVHALMHITCDLPKISSCPEEKFMTYLGRNFGYKQPSYMDLVGSIPGVTGIIMTVVMAFTFTLAMHSFRRNVVKLPWPFHYLAGFNAFWYAHHLLVLVYVLLVVHGYFLFLSTEFMGKTVKIDPLDACVLDTRD